MTLKTFASYGKDGEKKAHLTCEYLNEAFTMCRDYPLTVIDFGDTGHYWDAHWCIQMEKHLVKYSNTIEEMRSAARDFWAGYQAGLKDK